MSPTFEIWPGMMVRIETGCNRADPACGTGSGWFTERTNRRARVSSPRPGTVLLRTAIVEDSPRKQSGRP